MKKLFVWFQNDAFSPATGKLKQTLFQIIFESDTKAGKAFDVLLLLAILGSVLVVILDSVPGIEGMSKSLLMWSEWFFTIAFTIEYLIRLLIVKKPQRYALSFYGLIDLLSILPTYLSLLFVGTQYLLVVRALRLLRIFRILKLTHFLTESQSLATAIVASARKIAIFILFIIILVTILGSVMYMVEGPETGFTSIPESIYWAIVTLTTVGYGDISPGTPLGKLIASVIMLCGYGIIAVPTGIVTSEITLQAKRERSTSKKCPTCDVNNPGWAKFCGECGKSLISDPKS